MGLSHDKAKVALHITKIEPLSFKQVATNASNQNVEPSRVFSRQICMQLSICLYFFERRSMLRTAQT